MAWIIKNKDDMAEMLDYEIGRLQDLGTKGNMLLLPLPTVVTQEDLSFVLGEQRKFHKCGDEFADNRIGILRLSTKPNVLDTLHALSGKKRVNPVMERAAFDCQASPKAFDRRRLVLVRTYHGDIYVDVKAFAKLTGQSLEPDHDNMYAVFVYPVENPKHSEDKLNRVFVAIREEPTDIARVEGLPDSLETLIPNLENRSCFDNPHYHYFPELQNGYDLQAHPRFCEMLSRLRPGYSYNLQQGNDGVLYMMY